MQPVKLVAANGQHGYRAFRNPAIARTPSSTLILAFEGHRENPGVGQMESVVLVSSSSDCGNTWSEPMVVCELDPVRATSQFCPSFVIDSVTGRVFLLTSLFFGDGGEDNDSDILHMELSYSDDSGKTWRTRDITTQVTGPNRWRSRSVVPGHGIQLSRGIWTGRLMQPIVIEDEAGIRRFVAVCSDDQGATWWAGNPVGEGALDCAVTEMSDGRVMMKSRVGDGANCVSIFSQDGGRNWEGEKACFASAPRGCTAMIERAFPWAPEDSQQAKVVFHPMLTYVDNQVVTHSELLVSEDDLSSWSAAAAFDTRELEAPDIAPMPECRLAVVAFGTSEGIAMTKICYDDLGLRDLSYGWNKSPEEQDEILRKSGLIE